MGRWSDFFAMSKHERRGALVLLLLVAMVVTMFFVVRCAREGDVVVDRQAVEAFDLQTDTAVGLMNQPRHKKGTKGRKKSGGSSDSTKTKSVAPKKGKRANEKKSGKPAPQRDINREVPRLPQED